MSSNFHKIQIPRKDSCQNARRAMKIPKLQKCGNRFLATSEDATIEPGQKDSYKEVWPQAL